MPSYRFSDFILPLNQFDVVGSHGQESRFVGHVGLVASDNPRVGNDDSVPIFDMGPPLRGMEKPHYLKADVVGQAILTSRERRKIQEFVDFHFSEHKLTLSNNEFKFSLLEIYCVLPHAQKAKDADGNNRRTRFSCAGFVFEAYKFAGILLVNLDALPKVDYEKIKQAYLPQLRLMERIGVAPEAIGLEEGEDLPVLFCGYLIHALNRDFEAIRREPYCPTVEDWHFPRLAE